MECEVIYSEFKKLHCISLSRRFSLFNRSKCILIFLLYFSDLKGSLKHTKKNLNPHLNNKINIMKKGLRILIGGFGVIIAVSLSE